MLLKLTPSGQTVGPRCIWFAASPSTTRMVIEGGASIHAQDHAFWTLLYQAYRKNDPALLELLIINGANMEAEAWIA